MFWAGAWICEIGWISGHRGCGRYCAVAGGMGHFDLSHSDAWTRDTMHEARRYGRVGGRRAGTLSAVNAD